MTLVKELIVADVREDANDNVSWFRLIGSAKVSGWTPPNLPRIAGNCADSGWLPVTQ